jgi:hypothetical protein
MAYTAFDVTKPAGTQTGSAFATSANANDVAAMHGLATGALGSPNWTWSVTGGTNDKPTTVVLTNVADGTKKLRYTIAYGSGHYASSVTVAYSTDSGSSYPDTIGTFTFTYTSNELTAGNAGSFVLGRLMHAYGFLRSLYTSVSDHAALSGTSVHGLGTISTQAANNVAITGGYASVAYEREAKVAKGNISSSTAIDWAAGGLQTMTVTGSGATLTHSNLPNGVVGFVTLDVTNGGVASSLLTGCKFPGGAAPSLTASGRDIISLMCHDGATVNVVGVIKAMA